MRHYHANIVVCVWTCYYSCKGTRKLDLEVNCQISVFAAIVDGAYARFTARVSVLFRNHKPLTCRFDAAVCYLQHPTCVMGGGGEETGRFACAVPYAQLLDHFSAPAAAAM